MPDYPNNLPAGPHEEPIEHKDGVAPRIGKHLFPHKDKEEINTSPYIPNNQVYTVNEDFLNDDIGIFYVDGCRFLPENSSFT